MTSDRFLKSVLCSFSVIIAGLLIQADTAAAQAASEVRTFDGSKARVNLSNKLRMLSQQITSASCRVNASIDMDNAKEELRLARNEFNTILAGLENGSTALGIPSAETFNVVLKSIEDVRATWAPVDDATQTLLANGAGKPRAAEVIASSSDALLQATMVLSSDVSGRYSNPQELTQADAMAMNIAGRQRMLGHQIASEICGIATQNKPGETMARLGESVDMYTVSLNALRDGMAEAGINPPPTDAVRKELATVSATWNENKQVLDAIRGGYQPSVENVEAVARFSSTLMTEMDNVVTLYMLASPGTEDIYRVPLKAYAEQHLSKWLENEQLIEAIRAQNQAHRGLSQADIDQLDLDWRAQRKADSKPLIDRLLSQPASAWLRGQQEDTAQFVTEVFAMDNHGLNVAQSVETSDYWQGDEAKWQQTYGNGSGEIHISEVEFDESTGSYQSQVSMPVKDPATGELIGAITFGINVQSLL